MLGSSPIASSPNAVDAEVKLSAGGPVASSPIAASPVCGSTFDNVVSISVESPNCFLLLTDGSNLLLTDGVSRLGLAQCDKVPAAATDGHHAYPSVWYYRKLAERKRRLRDEEYRREVTLRYVERLVDAFVEADAKDAERLAESARRLDGLIDRTNTQFAYVFDAVARFVAASETAARAENRRQIEAKLIEAAALAQRIEAELIDEEEATLLLLAA